MNNGEYECLVSGIVSVIILRFANYAVCDVVSFISEILESGLDHVQEA